MIPYIDPCPNCGGFVEAKTQANVIVASLETVMPGDILECTACQCWAMVGSEQYPDWEGKCESCLNHGIQSMLMALIQHPKVEYAVVTVEG